VRLIALMVTVTLSGPAVGSLLCDFVCMAKHQTSPAAVGRCHEPGSRTAVPAFVDGHRCHDLAASTASVLTTAPQVELGGWAIVDTLTHETSDQTRDPAAARPPGLTHAPPALLRPLRI